MKTKYNSAVKLATYICLALLGSSVLAAEITLYDQPQAKAKVLGKVDLEVGIIPIYTPQGSDWIKIADPRNGNVGWIKESDIKTGNNFTFTQKFVSKGGKVPQSYSIIQFGTPQKMSNAQVDEMVKKMQMQQRAIQATTNQALQRMMEDMNRMSQQHWLSPWSSFPVIMPVLIVPAPEQKATTGKGK